MEFSFLRHKSHSCGIGNQERQSLVRKFISAGVSKWMVDGGIVSVAASLSKRLDATWIQETPCAKGHALSHAQNAS